MENALYFVGFALVALYLLLGIDDVIWDIITLIRKNRRTNRNVDNVDIVELDSLPPKLLAVVIAAWHEENVLGEVIDNIISSAQYPQSMYHIFLGVYPNDVPTIEVARSLEKKHPNVHVIINHKDGPTSKAQNINHMIRVIKDFEKEKNWSFASLTVHDAEDVVHPYEFKVTNYLLDAHDLLQFPVFPLIRKPTFFNFFDNITTGTYADEFAENHYITMRDRRNLGALVPSAGTGFVMSRKLLEDFGDEEIFPEGSLTEDYRLALTFFEKGIQAYYVLERVPRVTPDHKLVWDYIATRSMFPKTFKAAVKQKTRWVFGITMQSFGFKDIIKNKHLSLAGRYTMYKDLKPKISNLLVFVGYPVLIYVLISLFNPNLPTIYPRYSLSFYLSIAVTVMMIERQLFRAVAVYKVYGMRSVFFACLFPPFIPLRLVWGNLINMVATIRAYRQRRAIDREKRKEPSPNKNLWMMKIKDKKQPVWSKTEHSFLSTDVLQRYHRRLGDILLEKGYLASSQLNYALQEIETTEQLLGRYLIEQYLIKEEHLIVALSKINNMTYVETSSLKQYNLTQFANFFDEEVLRAFLAAPLLKTDNGFVVAFCDNSHKKSRDILESRHQIKITPVLMSEIGIRKAINTIFHPEPESEKYPQTQSLIFALYEQGNINYEQTIIAYNYKTVLEENDVNVLSAMGLIIT